MFSVHRKKKHRTVTVVCGGCGGSEVLVAAKKIKVPADDKKCAFQVDGRARTPTGGKFGMPGSANKRLVFRKMVTAWGCVSCQGIYKVIDERL